MTKSEKETNKALVYQQSELQNANEKDSQKTFSTNNSPQRDRNIDIRTIRVYSDYLQGLDNVRQTVDDQEKQVLQTLLKEYYKTKQDNGTAYHDYNKQVNDTMEECNAELKKYLENTMYVDGQVPIATMINKVKTVSGSPNLALTSVLTDYWERLKLSLECFQIVTDTIEMKVLRRLAANCLTFEVMSSPSSLMSRLNHSRTPKILQPSYESLKLPDDYRNEVTRYNEDIGIILATIRLLIASSGTHMNISQLGKSSILEHRILVDCNIAEYPILRLIPDVVAKLENTFRIARQWMDIDETYLYQIGLEIHKTKSQTRAKEAEVEQKKQQQQDFIKSVKSSFLTFRNSKKKLNEIVTKLKYLESQIVDAKWRRIDMVNFKKQKESVVDFLQLSIAQTRKNYNLQLKRQSLQRQIKDLESNIKHIQKTTIFLKEELKSAIESQKQAEEQCERNEQTLNEIRRELDRFSSNLHQLQRELGCLISTLSHLEGLQSVKISPERIENFYDEPVEKIRKRVKIAPSLRDKILKNRENFTPRPNK